MIILSEDWGAAFADGVETTVENRKTSLESFTMAAENHKQQGFGAENKVESRTPSKREYAAAVTF